MTNTNGKVGLIGIGLLILKDVRLILEMAARSNAATPLSQIHRSLLEEAQRRGFGEADNSAVIRAFRRPDEDQ